MRIENSFEVGAPIDQVWLYLLDVERVVPCMPGARITETVDDRTWRGQVNVKLGPVALSFVGDITMEERDDATYRAVMKLAGKEQRGKGAASATVTSTLRHGDGRTHVTVAQDISVTGQAAQFGRGILQEISTSLMRQFATCLETNLAEEDRLAGDVRGRPNGDRRPAAASEVHGVRLLMSALVRRIGRFVARVGRRRPAP